MRRSREAKDRTIATFGARARRLNAAETYETTLQTIVEIYDMRAELFTNDADCAASLADRARAVLTKGSEP